ncbi:MAG TPA: helix-turn-helix domain-containing protein [Candidatus Scybalomonas excrementigallinarum]|uniref:Uncharacterized protein n=1 Tax=Siphoviridae sp. ctdjo3 TaxID=2825583 RepID=A0A8S5PTK4_9CAUD|nr:MAG TPA: hypothetical protein [Siphoviridae sp. ctdjo3]HIS61118.1 helix-turn-helix domain-containing protein [Candidatus Scybalomonas excrementigallinarum]
MRRENVEELAKVTAKKALAEFKKEEKKEYKKRIYMNTELLMKNYNKITDQVKFGISESEQIKSEEVEELDEGAIFIKSIRQSKMRSMVMIAHVDWALECLEKEQKRLGEQQKYAAFKDFYLNEKKQEELMKKYHASDRTLRRWNREMLNKMGVFLFGVDHIM